MIKEVLTITISLIGFLLGVILSYIAPEELKPGKKYFIFMKGFLFYLILAYSLFLFIYFQNFYFTLIPIIYFPINLFYIKKQRKYLQTISNYLFFIIIYITITIMVSNNNLLIILPVLIFLYGLPAGTLFRKFNYDI